MSDRPDTEYDPERVVIRDKRRLDPESGEVRATPPPTPLEPEATPPEPEHAEASPAVDREAELLADLQRERAQFLNFKRRTEADHLATAERMTASLLDLLLPLFDDIDRAREHGDLTGGFKGVGEALEGVGERLGLQRFGTPGEPFDPNQHEALMAADPDPSSPVAVCAQVLQQGYRLRSGRVLRPARVAVAEGGAAVTQDEPTELVEPPTVPAQD